MTAPEPRIAILTRPDDRSPRILASSLQAQFAKLGVPADIHYQIDALTRLVPFVRVASFTRFHYWVRNKLARFLSDRATLRRMRHYDVVVICECIPNAFWRHLYNVELFRERVRKPVIVYEVYYLGNAPSQMQKLKAAGDPLLDRFDFHFAVAPITEIRSEPSARWSCIGLDLTPFKLDAMPRARFIAVVDFRQPGHDATRDLQLEALQELEIETVALDGEYSIEELRDIYRSAAVFLMQSPEAFGVSIAESLACGVQIFSPDASWPMSWRLQSDDKDPSAESLPEVFTIYGSRQDLKNKLAAYRDSYDHVRTPQLVRQSFLDRYPEFYSGNPRALKHSLEQVLASNYR